MNLNIVYDFQHVSKVTPFDFWLLDLASTASILKDGRISLEIPSFYWHFFFQNILSGSENFSDLNDLTRCGNITGPKKRKTY